MKEVTGTSWKLPGPAAPTMCEGQTVCATGKEGKDEKQMKQSQKEKERQTQMPERGKYLSSLKLLILIGLIQNSALHNKNEQKAWGCIEEHWPSLQKALG